MKKQAKIIKFICNYCKNEMILEDNDYCCDNCGATYNAENDKWTKPTIPKNQ